MSHEYEFTVWGYTRDEIEQKAIVECARYFGATQFRYEIDADAMVAMGGAIITVEARVTAREYNPAPRITFEPESMR